MAKKGAKKLTTSIETTSGISPKASIYSFFSCSGFLDLGFELADRHPFELRMANEIEKNFRVCYRYAREHLTKKINVPDGFIFENSITDFLEDDNKNSIRLKELIDEDVNARRLVGFIGGPPCPDFSIAGKGAGRNGKVGPLSNTYIDLILKRQPDFFLFENVKGLYCSQKHRAYFDELCEKLADKYYLSHRLVNSLWYGVAQGRERLILVGFKKNTFKSVSSNEDLTNKLRWKDFQPFRDLVETAFKDKAWPRINKFRKGTKDDLSYPKNLDKRLRALTVAGCWEENDVENHPNDIVRTKPRDPSKGKYVERDEGMIDGKSYLRFHRWRYAPTAAYGHNEIPLHPWDNRRISLAEALATQSLPKDFCFPGDDVLSRSSLFKAVGNGVPYKMSKLLAQMIAEFLESYNV